MTTLLDLVMARHLTPPPRRVAGTHGGEWHSPCPVCGGKDRFHFWPERLSTGSCTVPGVWGCRQCDMSGDAIAFLMHADGLSFKDACKRLGQDITPDAYKPARLPRPAAAKEKLEVTQAREPGEVWQEAAARLVKKAHESIQSAPGPLKWLAARGLDETAVRRFRLGYLPGERGQAWYTRSRKGWGLPEEEINGKLEKTFRYPRGLLIPQFDDDGRVAALRIRRTKEDIAAFPNVAKYLAVKGSPVRPFIVLPDFPLEASGMVVVESHLDAMLIAELARRSGIACGAIALVSNTARPDEETDRVCRAACRLLLCLDIDPAGSGGQKATDKAVTKWLATYPRAMDWPVPQGKDPGEAFALGVDIPLWLMAGLPPMCQPKPAAGLLFPSGSECVAVEGDCAVSSGGETPKKRDGATVGEGGDITATQSASAVPADVLALHRLMQRFGVELRVNVVEEVLPGRRMPVTLGLVCSSKFRMEQPAYFKQFANLVHNSLDVARWLDTHPVRSGRINAQNLLDI